MNPLFEALADGDLEKLAGLLAVEPTLADDEDGNLTPLMFACQLRNEEAVRILLKAGADPNYIDAEKETALHIASFDGSEDAADTLIAHGADVAARTKDGKTPLMSAAQAGSLHIVKGLLSAGADAKATDDAGRTALHWTMLGQHEHIAVVGELLQAGADPAQKNANGDTALEYARAMGKPRLERYLVSR